MQLSDNFTLSELTKSSTAARHGIDNTPNAAQIENLKLVCEKILEPVRANFHRPIKPSSGFRSLALNRRIGSKDTSQHTKSEAVDFEVPGVDNFALHNWIKKNLDFDQNILEFYKDGDPASGWCHVSYRRTGNRNMSFSVG